MQINVRTLTPAHPITNVYFFFFLQAFNTIIDFRMYVYVIILLRLAIIGQVYLDVDATTRRCCNSFNLMKHRFLTT
jgi:hypothetical protein